MVVQGALLVQPMGKPMGNPKVGTMGETNVNTMVLFVSLVPTFPTTVQMTVATTTGSLKAGPKSTGLARLCCSARAFIHCHGSIYW